MHVAIDARELVGRPTGVGRYLDRLLTHWGAMPAAHAHRYTLFAHEPLAAAAPGLEATHVVLPGRGGTRWEQTTLASAIRRSRPDVLFAPGYTAPLLCGVPWVLTVHDVSFAARPEWFRWRERWRRRLLTRAAARRARLVLTVSEFSRREIVERLGVPPARVQVVRHGIDAAAGARQEGRTAGPPLVLFVGSVLNRRHVPELVEAVAITASRVPGIRLVIAGDNRSWPRQDPAAVAAALGMSDRVEVRAFVSDEELRRLYGAATVFVFLSEYEGFGLTPLEALAAGVPPVVLDTPVAREVYGPAAHYVDRPDPVRVAAAIAELCVPGARRAELLAAAPPVLDRYRWPAAAAATLEALEAV